MSRDEWPARSLFDQMSNRGEGSMRSAAFLCVRTLLWEERRNKKDAQPDGAVATAAESDENVPATVHPTRFGE